MAGLIDDLKSWMPHRLRVNIDELAADTEQGTTEVLLTIVTGQCEYKIRARRGHPGDSDYLGCIARSRQTKPGEDWLRGNDLHDGPCTRLTWDAIMADIVGYESIAFEMPEPEFQQAVAAAEADSAAPA